MYICMYIYIYIYIYIFIYLFIYIYQFESHLMMCWTKIKNSFKNNMT